MINGAHVLLHSSDADADRGFLRDVLGFSGVDVGGGWLIFTLPLSELAVHPADGAGGPVAGAELYLMCDDIEDLVGRLAVGGVRCAALTHESWGVRTAIPLPSGGTLGLYQPTHPTALGGSPPTGPPEGAQ